MINASQPLSAIHAFSEGMQATAHNVANVNTNDYNALDTTFVDNKYAVNAHIEEKQSANLAEEEAIATDYAEEAVNMILYNRSLEANTASIRTQDEMLGTVIDMKV